MIYPIALPLGAVGLPRQLSVHGAGAAGEEMASSHVPFSLGFDAGPSWHVLFWRAFKRLMSPIQNAVWLEIQVTGACAEPVHAPSPRLSSMAVKN